MHVPREGRASSGSAARNPFRSPVECLLLASVEAPSDPRRADRMIGLVDAGLALAVGLVAAPVVLWTLHRAAVLDVPNARSSHDVTTPRAGGLGPAVACTVAGAVSSGLSGASRSGVLFVAVCMGLIGLIDDLRQLSPFLRLAGQLLVASIAVVWLAHDLDGSAAGRVVACVAVVVWVVAYVNAFNFMDGINGLAVAQTGVAGIAWWVVGVNQNVPALAVAGLVAAAAAASFAPFNVPHASMFLGDVGSYFLGGWLAATAIVGLRAGIPPEAMLAPLTLYAADTFVTLVRRIRRHEVWYEPHRDHTYQQVVKAGWSHGRTSLVVGIVMATISALGTLSLTGSTGLRVIGDVLVIGALATYLAMPRLLGRGGAPGPTAPSPA